jgi:hypothetical protein
MIFEKCDIRLGRVVRIKKFLVGGAEKGRRLNICDTRSEPVPQVSNFTKQVKCEMKMVVQVRTAKEGRKRIK